MGVQAPGLGRERLAALAATGVGLRARARPQGRRDGPRPPVGILNAVVLQATNGPAESINSRIQMVKARTRGYRNYDRFVVAILFRLGGLDLSPRTGPSVNW